MRRNDREEFIARFVRECPRTYLHGETIAMARKFLRLSTAHGNLAEAYCNGDYPYHGNWNINSNPLKQGSAIPGPRHPIAQCGECETDQVRSSMALAHPRKRSKAAQTGTIPLVCKKCRIEKQLRQLCETTKHFKLVLQQDPRGWTVRLLTPEGIEIGVPQ